MRYREFRPKPALQPWVRSIWTLECNAAAAPPQRVVPDGHMELILNWRDPYEAFQDGCWRTQPRLFLSGQIHGPLLLRPTGPAKILGITFRPDSASHLFRAPMQELSERFTPVADLSRTLGRRFDDSLAADDPITAVENALLDTFKMTRGDQLIGEAVSRIESARGSADLGTLAKDLGVSVRQFERRFQTSVGLPPKLFCRIRRFRQIFELLEQESIDWVDAALAYGYYDQSHLIRDCRDLSGTTPAILFDENADLARHFYTRYRVSHSYNTSLRD